MNRTILAAALVLAACGGGDASSTTTTPSVRACVDVFAVGQPGPDDDTMCLADGQLTLVGNGTHECPDGSIINYNDYAIWRTGETIIATPNPDGISFDELDAACSDS